VAPIPRQPYTKPALSPHDLLAHLQARGLVCPDPAAAVQRLEYVGYYRLLVYMRALQQPDPQTGVPTFLPGTTFDDVLYLYGFDRELRLLCLDAIERIEVALRAAIVNQVAVAHGPHFFLEREHFERMAAFVEFYQNACRDRRYLAIRHYEQRYSAPELAPIWAIMEVITYGALSRLFSGLRLAHRKAIARQFGFDETVLASWFRSLNLLRNMCAHHNRLWNAPMHVDQPVGAKKLRGELGRTDVLYARLVILASLLDVMGAGAEWKRRLVELLGRYPRVSPGVMGFPEDWRSRELWQCAPPPGNDAEAREEDSSPCLSVAA
jgi:abortive infection bacteriophage resistance protein